MGRVEGVFRSSRETRTVPAGAVVFTEGDPGTEMFGVVDGRISLRHGDEIVGEVGPDEVFGELALVDSSPRTRTAVAECETTLAVIDERQFLFLVQETPLFALQVMRTIASRLRSVDSR